MRPAFFFLMLFMTTTPFARAEDNVKPAGLAGTWYPAGKAELSSMIDGFLAEVRDIPPLEDIGAILSPHAGYVFSGPVAAWGFRAAQTKKIGTVIVLAPTHHVSFPGASVWAAGAFTTPLGRLEVDEDLASRILAFDKRFSFRKDVFKGGPGRPENSVETQLPFIQKAFPGAKIVPIIMGYPPDAEIMQAMARALAAAVQGRDDVLVDVSVDQSHFHPDAEAREIDGRGLRAIEKMDINAFLTGHMKGTMEVDGAHVVATAMLYAQEAGYEHAEVLRYGTSADTTGEKDSVVGYASVVFSRGKRTDPLVATEKQGAAPLTSAQKKRLLEIARSTLDTFVRTGKVPRITEDDARLSEEEGAFVTLHQQGRLRGCIGNIIGDGPLYQTVRDMAVAASSQDPRFDPVTADELKDIDVEISVLSKPRVVRSADEIVMGTHGVIVSRGRLHRGVFLPQVATETGWSRERFLSELCSQKAGLPSECWKTPEVTLEVFTAEVFGEKG